MRYDVLAILIIAVGCLFWLHRGDRLRTRRRRSELFNECATLLQFPEILNDGVHLPILRGRFDGYQLKAEPIVDDILVRKIPMLWLNLSLVAPVPYSGALDILIRARGCEIYSPIYDLETELAAPANWPRDLMIRCSDPATAPPLSLFDRHLPLLRDPKCKEIIVAPGGVRLIYQIAQARRAEYSVLRRVEFEQTAIPRDTALRLLREICSIYQTFANSEVLDVLDA